MSIYRARLRNTSNALSPRVSSEQIRLQVPPKLFRVDSWIPQIIGQWIHDCWSGYCYLIFNMLFNKKRSGYLGYDHPRRGVLIVSVTSVSLYVCNTYHCFRNPSRGKFFFGHPLHLEGIRVKFVYEGHRVKVKVTGAKEREISCSRNVQLIDNNSDI